MPQPCPPAAAGPARLAASARPAAAQDPALGLSEPVIILTSARTGSTLLRLLLDSHPALACPPETNIAKTASQLASVWGLLAGGTEAPPEAALRAVRQVLDQMFASYLDGRGKTRWCDKSLGTAEVAENFLALYPDAKFLCLYRHGMDVIASALEACPWGVSGYGFEPYVSNSPGNSVAAVAHYWADHTSAVLEFERAHPGNCLRVRYEDLAVRPTETAARIFSWLGVPDCPGITSRFLDHPAADAAGPADYKIWATREISAGSVGRGVRIPLTVIPEPLVRILNGLLEELDYPRLERDWDHGPDRYQARPMSGQDGTCPAGPEHGGTDPGGSGLRETVALLADRIAACLPGLAGTAGRALLPGPGGERPGGNGHGGPEGAGAAGAGPEWPARAAVSVFAPGSFAARQTILVDFAAARVSPAGHDVDGCAWELTGDAGTWRALLAGQANLGVTLRQGQLRYVRDEEGSARRIDNRLHFTARMLGLAR